MNRLIERAEKTIVTGLLVLMLIVVVAGSIELIVVVFEAMAEPPRFLLLAPGYQ